MLRVWNTRAEVYIGNTIEYDVQSYPSQNNHSKMYKCMHKRIEF